MKTKEKKWCFSKIWGIAKWVVAFMCFALFTFLAAEIMEAEVLSLDKQAYRFVSTFICPFFTIFFDLVTNFAHPVVMVSISLAMIFVYKQKRYWILIFSNLALATMLNLALKSLFARVRPIDVIHLADERGYSFPSGHSMLSAAFYGFIIFLVWQSGKSRRSKIIQTVLWLLVILLVGLSRIYLGVHFASDVLGGFSISAAYLIIFTSIISRYFAEGEREMEDKTTEHSHKLAESFRHAFMGIMTGLKNERNLMIHFSAMALVILFGAILKLSVTEWCICFILFALVIATEMINTAIEILTDMVQPKLDPKAKMVKDTAAGAVLVCAIAAVAAGALIFGPKLWVLILELIA